jgi:hypothetical protein
VAKLSILLHTVLGQANLDEAVALSGQTQSHYVASFVGEEDPNVTEREK